VRKRKLLQTKRKKNRKAESTGGGQLGEAGKKRPGEPLGGEKRDWKYALLRDRKKIATGGHENACVKVLQRREIVYRSI